MLKENAVVIGYEMGLATVKCQSQSGCGQCLVKDNCGITQLSELNGKRGEHIFTLATITPLKIGQIVEIGLQERSVLVSVWLLYVIPLFSLVLTTLLFHYLVANELIRVILIFLCTAICLLLVKKIAKNFDQHIEFQPILLRVIN